MLLKDIPCIKDQAYFIMVGLEGSWLYNATYPANQDEAWCKNFVNCFEGDYGLDVEYVMSDGQVHTCNNNAAIQQHIDDSYDDIIEYRMKETMDKATSRA